MVHGGSRGGSSRAHAYAHIICVPCFFEKQVFRADGRGLKGGGMTENPETEDRFCPNGAKIMALFILGIKGAEKKDTLLSKK